MRTLYVVFVTALLVVATLGFAQQPTLVWERQFDFGYAGLPWGIQTLPNGNVVANGVSIGGSNGNLADRATIAGFDNDGIRQWLHQDSTFPGHSKSFSGHLATIPAENAIVWFEGERGAYDPSWIVKLNAVNGAELWRLPVNRLMFLGNHTDTSFVAILPGNNPIAFFHRANGTVWRQFSLGGTMESIVTAIASENTLWVGAQYPGGVNTSLSYLVAKYDIATGQQLWRQNFVDVVRGFTTVDQETGEAYVFGTRVVNDPQGLLKFVRARLDQNGGTVWNREWFGREGPEANYHNWAEGVSVVGSVASKQVVLVSAVQRDPTNTGAQDARAWGIKVENGDSLWEVTRSDNSLCYFSGVVRSGNNHFIVLETVWQGGNPSTGYGKLLKFTAPTLSVNELPGLPESFRLGQNYPNPFNPSTTIRFDLFESAPVRLVVVNVLGEEVATLVDEELGVGKYEVTWDGHGLPSGAYFYRLIAGKLTETRKMVLLK